MRLYLDIIEGPAKGQKISLSQNATLGRQGSDIVIEDGKLSGTHAFFEFSKDEGWSIRDNQSRNGVWVNGLKEFRMVLRDGDILHLGSSRILCRMLEVNQQKLSEPFQLWVQNQGKEIQDKKNTISEIKPEMRLRVVQGIQYGETWDIYYGPRRAGRESLDICLYEDKAPRNAFAIQVKGRYPYFATNHENIVKMNDKNVKTKQFQPGDIITIGESQILVEFDEGNGFGS